MKTLGLLQETKDMETRVAITPNTVANLVSKCNLSVVVEKDAGLKAGFCDQDYLSAGAVIVDSCDQVIDRSDIIVAVNGDLFFSKSGLTKKTLIALFDPYFNQANLKKLKESGASIIALELIPRISRAQSMDVLSSQANIAGYVASIMVAQKLNKVMPLMMTAAGTIEPAKVLVLGAGVAGLQAIATVKRLGCVVYSYDVRSIVKEQVESLGAKFVDISLGEDGEGVGGYAKALSDDEQAKQRSKLTSFAGDMDAIITTAQIPGKKAPKLLDDEIFSMMKNNSIIIDMASTTGGNVSGAIPNEWSKKENVWLYGADNLSRMVAKDASFTFGKNIKNLLELMLTPEGDIDMSDEVIKSALIK